MDASRCQPVRRPDQGFPLGVSVGCNAAEVFHDLRRTAVRNMRCAGMCASTGFSACCRSAALGKDYRSHRKVKRQV